ncbi:MAG: hypothetical protein ACTSUE_16705 [Promethearchaeota archaeon]
MIAKDPKWATELLYAHLSSNFLLHPVQGMTADDLRRETLPSHCISDEGEEEDK